VDGLHHGGPQLLLRLHVIVRYDPLVTAWASLRRRSSSLGLRAVTLALAATVLCASVFSGWSYIWCVPMHRAMETACQIEHHQDGSGPSARGVCCEAREHSHLPVADARAALDAAPPPPALPATDLPRVVEVPRLPAVAQAQRLRPARYGLIRAGPRSAAARVVALQVMRC
jgi:hypothetical protein